MTLGMQPQKGQVVDLLSTRGIHQLFENQPRHIQASCASLITWPVFPRVHLVFSFLLLNLALSCSVALCSATALSVHALSSLSGVIVHPRQDDNIKAL